MMNTSFTIMLYPFLLCLPLLVNAQSTNLLQRAAIPYLKGESKTVIHPSPEPDNKKNSWFTNDHCFVTDQYGMLHWFGINNPYPPEGKELYRYHPFIGHFTSKNPETVWERQPHALDESKGTEYLGAPFVIWHNETQRWVMVLETWLDDRRLEVCWSDDLIKWERTKTAILPEKLWISTRDPHIMRGNDGKYWIHLVSTGNKGVKQSQVIRIRTSDFVSFDDPETILGINDVTWATLLESPFLLEKHGTWYLFFTYAHRRYTETIVVVSDNPDHFDYEKNTLTTLFGHAAEIFDYNGITYISSCGPEDKNYYNQHGITIAELGWAKPIIE